MPNNNCYFTHFPHQCGACLQYPCCCAGLPGPQGPAGAEGKSAYQIALDNGYVGTQAQWLESLKGQPGPFLSSYMEALGNGQSISQGASVVFGLDTLDSVGNNITLNQQGTVFTITQTGLYQVQWEVNLAPGGALAVIGIIENGEASSGATSSTAGNFSSGTLIHVDEVPFTLSLFNFAGDIALENPLQWNNTAASIRIVRFADGPSA